MISSWFVRPRPRPDARARLFCFPYAGVGASVYRPWAAELPPDLELVAVQPPGREARFREQPIAVLDELIEALFEEIGPWLDRDYAFFGHSMGACVAYELARRLARGGLALPGCLLLSGRRAPTISDDEPLMHTLSDERFVEEIRLRYDGIPEQVAQHPELMALLLPGLRADIAALERHAHVPSAPLACPIVALGGTGDPRVPASALGAWRGETAGAFSMRLFPGGHFYFQGDRGPLLDTLTAAVRASVRSVEPQPSSA